MYLSSRVDITQEHSRADWDRVLFIVDVSQVKIGIHIVGECLVADTRETVAKGLEGCSGG